MITVYWIHKIYGEQSQNFEDRGIAYQELNILLANGYKAWIVE